MKVLGMCIDKKVVAGVAAVAVGIWWLAPGAVAAALPLLLLAICPLSMLLMMKAMNGMGQGQGGPQPPADPQTTGGVPPAGAASPQTAVGADAAPTHAPVIGTDPRARWN